jgi:hypothetical protein
MRLGNGPDLAVSMSCGRSAVVLTQQQVHLAREGVIEALTGDPGGGFLARVPDCPVAWRKARPGRRQPVASPLRSQRGSTKPGNANSRSLIPVGFW